MTALRGAVCILAFLYVMWAVVWGQTVARIVFSLVAAGAAVGIAFIFWL